MRPDVSVVIPTFNRREQLERTLVGLAAQTDLQNEVEVIVVSDGSTDGTDEWLRSGATPLPVSACYQENAGPAAARNRGVAAARGPLVLFLDDDVVPAPDLVNTHVQHHHGLDDDVVVVGPMRTPDDLALSPWVQWEQRMLYKQYDAMLRGDWKATARQFYTANASLARRHFESAGGFDPAFRRAEDVELAYRLADAGLTFTFVPDAVVLHYAERSFASWLANASAYGRNDVIFGRDQGQAWLLDAIGGEFHDRHRLVRQLTRVSLRHKRLGKAVGSAAALTARAASKSGPERASNVALSVVYNLEYYRGMAEEFGDPRQLLACFDAAAGAVSNPVPRVGFVLEQTLGHVTHADNLVRLVTPDPRIRAQFAPVDFDLDRRWARVPGHGNWTVRAGLRARRAVRALERDDPLDALFVHTQVPATLMPDVLRRVPSVVSLDATPIQYDELGDHYGHATGSDRVEQAKRRLARSGFARANRLVTWSEWTKEGLVDDYDVSPDKIVVIAPGVDYDRWAKEGQSRGEVATGAPIRILFVGGDLVRKGGRTLIDSVRRLRADGAEVELDLVTKEQLPHEDGITVHNGLGPNSPALIELYRKADVFCLPTLGDCLPMVLSEAGAVGLPLVSTDVGAIREIVRPDHTGLLVPPGDEPALTAALDRLVGDPVLRRSLGTSARQLVRDDFNAAKNASRLVALLIDVAEERN